MTWCRIVLMVGCWIIGLRRCAVSLAFRRHVAGPVCRQTIGGPKDSAGCRSRRATLYSGRGSELKRLAPMTLVPPSRYSATGAIRRRPPNPWLSSSSIAALPFVREHFHEEMRGNGRAASDDTRYYEWVLQCTPSCLPVYIRARTYTNVNM